MEIDALAGSRSCVKTTDKQFAFDCLGKRPEYLAHVKQTSFFKTTEKSYGGELRKKRKGRGARPLSKKESIHLVLRSSQAKGEWSFLKHKPTIRGVFMKFAKKFGVLIVNSANVGNHLHLEIKITTRDLYDSFIRAVTGRLAQLVTHYAKLEKPFWDHRPFTRVVCGFKALLNLRRYIFINELEGEGCPREAAEWIYRGDPMPKAKRRR